MKKKAKIEKLAVLVTLIAILSIFFGFMIPVSFLLGGKLWILFTILYLLLCILNGFIMKLKWFEFFSVVLFPIYSIASLGSKFGDERGSFEFEDFEIEASESELRMDENVVGIPIIILRDFGTKEEKMNASKIILNLFKSGEIGTREAVNSLEKLTHDPHLDVAMYASDGLTSIENALVERILKARKSGEPEELVRALYEYATSGLLEGEIVGVFLKEALENAERIDDKNKRDFWIFRIKKVLKHEGMIS